MSKVRGIVFFISPAGVLSNKVPREGKNTAIYIIVSFIAVIAMIGIVATAAYCRYVNEPL